MLGESWLSEVLGSDAEHLNPTRVQEPATIDSVVQTFLHNEAKFSQEDVSRYINDALQNEAVDIVRGREMGELTAQAWASRARTAQEGDDVVVAQEAGRNEVAMTQAWQDQYDTGRTQFGQALHTALDSNRVRLTPRTCAWVIKLDDGGYLSESMGLDVKQVFGANRSFGPVASNVRPVDFSREASVVAAPVEPFVVRPHEQTQTKTLAEQIVRRGRRNPVRPGSASADLVASPQQHKLPAASKESVSLELG